MEAMEAMKTRRVVTDGSWTGEVVVDHAGHGCTTYQTMKMEDAEVSEDGKKARLIFIVSAGVGTAAAISAVMEEERKKCAEEAIDANGGEILIHDQVVVRRLEAAEFVSVKPMLRELEEPRKVRRGGMLDSDAGRRKGWQTCHGPAQRRGKGRG